MTLPARSEPHDELDARFDECRCLTCAERARKEPSPLGSLHEDRAEIRRLRGALERLHHLVVSPGDMGREEIRDEGRRIIEEALNA